MTTSRDAKVAELAPLLLDVPEAPAVPVAPADLPTARQQVAAQITLDHPNITAHPFIMVPETVTLGAPVASVYRSVLTNGPQANVLTHQLTIDLYVALTDGAGVEAEAEDALDAVLLTLQRMPGVTWSDAKRVTFEDGDYAGYSITATKYSKDHYLTAALAAADA